MNSEPDNSFIWQVQFTYALVAGVSFVVLLWLFTTLFNG